MRMVRFLLLTLTILTLCFSVPATACAASNYEFGLMGIPEKEVTITYSQGVLYVNGGEGKVLEVVSLTGRRLLEQQIDSPAQKIELNIPKGCYIVKVGSVVRKIAVR
jgi:hypothetical protein